MSSEKSEQFIVKLAGGIGNQLFQYALGKQLATRHGAELLFDTTSFTQDRHQRQFRLDYFNIPPVAIANETQIKPYRKYQRRQGRWWYLYNRFVANSTKYVQETQFHFDPRILEIKPSAYIDGYWQTEKYFQQIQSILRQEFTPIQKPSAYFAKNQALIKNQLDPVSLHVRRGDYEADPVGKKYHGGICTKAYYDKAITEICSRIEQPFFFIFSDDIEWAKQNILIPGKVAYVSEAEVDECDDLFLMSACHHHIMANSSFSWWGTWLNPHVNKLVIAPERWFNKGTTDLHDLLASDWIRIGSQGENIVSEAIINHL